MNQCELEINQSRLNQSFHGLVAQLIERLVRNEEAKGLNPFGSTIFHGVIAQLIERFNGIEEAEGLSPSGSTNFHTWTWYTGCAVLSKSTLSGFDSCRPCHFNTPPSSSPV